jgi:hypothetical protein
MISHHHKCIFIHIPKNAGQSIENVFLDLLNLDWETRAPLLLRPNDHPDLGPPRLAHLKSYEYVKYKYIPKELYTNYFKFAIVRNPFERVVSIYRYFGYSKKCSFKEFVNGPFLNELWKEQYWFVCPQVEYVYKNEQLNVDFICRFENLQEDFQHVCKQIGLPSLRVPHKNKSSKTKGNSFISKAARYLLKYIDAPQKKSITHDLNPKRIFKKAFPCGFFSKGEHHKNYQNYYDEETKKIIGRLYQQDIEDFGYQFESFETIKK